MRSPKPQPSRVPPLCKYVTRTDRHADAQTMQKSTAVKEREWKKLHPGLQINNCSGQTSWQISRNDKKGKKQNEWNAVGFLLYETRAKKENAYPDEPDRDVPLTRLSIGCRLYYCKVVCEFDGCPVWVLLACCFTFPGHFQINVSHRASFLKVY